MALRTRSTCAGAAAGGAGWSREHGDARFDAESPGGLGGGDGDFGELFGVGVGVDGAVAVHEDAVLEAHEEDGGDDGEAGFGADELEGGADGMGGGVDGAGDHAVGEALVHHHGAEVRDVGQDGFGHVGGDALFLAQVVIGFDKVAEVGGLGGLEDVHAGEVEAEVGDFGADPLDVAEEGDVGDAAQEDLLGGVEDAVFLAFGQDDALAGFLGALDEAEFEHLGGDDGGAGGGEQADEPLGIHVGFEEGEGGGDFAGGAGEDARVQAGDGGDGVVGGARDGQDGDHFLDILEEGGDGAGGLEAVGENDAGDVDGAGGIELEHDAEEVAEAVAGNEQERAVPELGEKQFRGGVGDGEGGGLEGVEQIGAVGGLGAEGLGDFAHHGGGERGVLRHGKDGQFGVARMAKQVGQGLHAAGSKPVEDGGEHLAVVFLEALHGEIETAEMAFLAGFLAVHDQQDGAPRLRAMAALRIEFMAVEASSSEVEAFVDDEIGKRPSRRCSVRRDAVEQLEVLPARMRSAVHGWCRRRPAHG